MAKMMWCSMCDCRTDHTEVKHLGHVGLYNPLGQYEGGCSCGWEGQDILGHVNEELEKSMGND